MMLYAIGEWVLLSFSIPALPSGGERGDAGAPAIMAKVRQARKAVEDTFERVKAAGLRFALGTDSMHGLFGFEIEWLVNHGVGAEDAIIAATRCGAEVLGIADEAGTLEPGKRADFVALRGNPLEDVRAVRDVAAVYKNGEPLVDEEGGIAGAD